MQMPARPTIPAISKFRELLELMIKQPRLPISCDLRALCAILRIQIGSRIIQSFHSEVKLGVAYAGKHAAGAELVGRSDAEKLVVAGVVGANADAGIGTCWASAPA